VRFPLSILPSCLALILCCYSRGFGSDEKSVLGGVYNAGQAKRGNATYSDKCSKCHGVDLTGGNLATSLVGSGFKSRWTHKNLRDLYGRILTTMPQEDPGSLSQKEVLDIVGYILQINGIPGGRRELRKPSDLEKINFSTDGAK
jgi:S-disulfanyl-L-cysteine oxidoreductase SoxD